MCTSGDLKTEQNNFLEISNSFRKAMHCPFSFILVSAVWMVRIRKKTVFLAYLIVLCFSFMFPLKGLQPFFFLISDESLFFFS